MAFQNSIAQWLSADGIPVAYFSNINLNNNVPVLLPPAGANFAPVRPRCGYVRVKSNLLKLNVNHKVGPITATDGTNVTNIYAGDAAAGSNGLFYDQSFFFWLDWGVANINITNIATTNNTATYDVEVIGIQ
jgi:hypothetical protein